MKYATPEAFRTALEQRLLRRAHETGVSLARLRKRVAFERLLARLLFVAPESWVLKGGLALDFRLPDRARSTVDMDLARRDGEGAASRDFRAAVEADLDDFFIFEVERTSRLDEADVGGAVRYKARASLAGRLFEEYVVDVGFAETLVLPVEHVLGPDLLTFAGVPPVLVPILPLPRHVAEKVHAYTRQYGDGRRPSTRIKDLVDLVLLCATEVFFASAVQEALQTVVESRGTHPLPSSLPTPPDDWRKGYRILADHVGIEPDLDNAYAEATAFLGPLLDGSLAKNDTRWDPSQRSWRVHAYQSPRERQMEALARGVNLGTDGLSSGSRDSLHGR